jgi:hypothetical protein
MALDMNIHGFFLATDETTTPGSLMRLTIALPEKTIALLGTARFVGRTVAGQGVGVEIFILDEASRSAWLSYYHSQLGADEDAASAQSLPIFAHRQA